MKSGYTEFCLYGITPFSRTACRVLQKLKNEFKFITIIVYVKKSQIKDIEKLFPYDVFFSVQDSCQLAVKESDLILSCNDEDADSDYCDVNSPCALCCMSSKKILELFK